MIDQLRKTFAGQRVFVTGHTGFKGPWLIAILNELGAEVTGFGLPPETQPALYDLIGGDDLCESVIGDLRDREIVEEALVEARPRFVLHLGAQSLVRRSYREPADTFDSNVTGTLNVLEAVRKLPDRCDTVIVTTDKVYAEQLGGPSYKETDPLGGYDPYSTSKAACEIICDGYRKSFFNPTEFDRHQKTLATARAGNVIGGGDWCEDRLIPDLARALAKNESVCLRNPKSTRPWQHVLEPLSGYLRLAAELAINPTATPAAFNFGPNDRDVLEVEKVIQLAIAAFQSGRYHVEIDPHAPHEAALLRIDSTRARNVLDWMPRWSAQQAVERTMAWYKRAASEDPLELTRQQIREYFQ